MMSPKPETYFLPPERKEGKEIKKAREKLIQITHLEKILNLLPHLLMILNEERQVVFWNKKLYDFLSLRDYEEILAARPGEVLNCKNADKMEGGCGTSKNCRYCGAAIALFEAQKTGKPASHQCRITTNNHVEFQSLMLRVNVHPHKLSGEQFYLFFIKDISDQKRLAQIERTFLHDLGNLINVLTANLFLFPKEGLNNSQKQYLEEINTLTHYIVDEIRSQQDFSRYESGDIEEHKEKIESHKIIKNLLALMQKRFGRDKKNLKMDEKSINVEFMGDRVLIRRILINLIKNALEETSENKIVNVGSGKQNSHIVFWVHNPTYIPPKIQAQLFQWGFSTKGEGRGMGLYSIKMILKEIGGKIDYTTSIEKGTEFRVYLNTK